MSCMSKFWDSDAIVSVRKVGILVKFPRSIVVVTLEPCLAE